jgi:protoporphyrinogen oxidase
MAAGKNVVILGGGVCGLYAARRLTKAGFSVSLVEKMPHFGGLAVSERRGKNFYDIGVHMLHEHDQEIYEDCMAMMGEESVPVELKARIRWAGSFYRYPLQFADMVRGMAPLTLGQCVMGLFAAQLRNKIAPWEPDNCEEALIQLYGKPLYRFFFEDFTHRYWGRHPTEISAMFVKRKMPRLTAVDAIKKMLGHLGIKEKGGRSVESALLTETLHYSRTGAEAMPRLIAKRVKQDGARLFTDSKVALVGSGNGQVSEVTVRNSRTGATKTLPADHVISTVPVNALVGAIRPVAPRAVRESCAQLRWLPVVIFGLLVKKEKVMDALYTYYRERVFHRVGEPKNAGLVVEPEGHTVLIVEMTCELGDAKWEGAESMKQQVYADLEKENLCKAGDVVETHVLRNEHGYPVFALGYEPHHERIVRYLDEFDNLQSVGRQGGFTFPNMHSAMRMGADAADAIIAKS